MSRPLSIDRRSYGPPNRVEVFWGTDGDGHGSLLDLLSHHDFMGTPAPTFMQRSVEYFYPWEPTPAGQEQKDV